MAPRGDLPGWRQVFVDDFTTDVPLGSFPGTRYGDRWATYDGFSDTSGNGTYSSAETLSVRGGALDMHLRTQDGRALASAVVPLGGSGGWAGQTYGKYSLRFRADAIDGYGLAFLLWPASNDWHEGEVDFPEGDLAGTIHAFNHCMGDPTRNCFAKDTGVPFTGWHTASTEWTPKGVRFLLDDRLIGTSAVSPSSPLRLTLQAGTAGRLPPAHADGHVQIDWVAIYSRT